MTGARRIKMGMVLGMASFGTDALVSLFIFPLLLSKLGRIEAGFWLLLLNLGNLLSGAFNGLGPTVVRAVGALMGSAENVREMGGPAAQLRANTTRLYLGAIFLASILAVIVWFFILSGGPGKSGMDAGTIGIAWILFVFGWALRQWSIHEFSWLDGAGHVGLNRVATTICNILNLLLLIGLLAGGLGVLAPVMAYLLSSLAIFMSGRFLFMRMVGATKGGPVDPGWDKMRRLAGDGLKMGLLGVTSYVVSQSCILWVERNEGVATLATFGPVARLSMVMVTAALIPNTLLFPYLAKTWGAGDKGRFRVYTKVAMFLSTGLYLLPACVLWFDSEKWVGLWLGDSNYVGESVVRWFLIYGLLYVIHSSLALPALATGRHSFVFEAILNMALVVPAMFFAAHFLGLPGYPAGMFLGTLLPSFLVVRKSVLFFQECHNALVPRAEGAVNV
jgi:O-antigen/teichoic acid export membrane protein